MVFTLSIADFLLAFQFESHFMTLENPKSLQM